jgi:hypothetical protein
MAVYRSSRVAVSTARSKLRPTSAMSRPTGSHLKQQFVIPPDANAAFVAAMSAFRQRELTP